MKAQLAFYKAENGNWVDKLIAWWTNSPYSHVELVVDGWWYSTSPRDLAIRKSKIVPKEGNWDYIYVEVDGERLDSIYGNIAGASYDWTGICMSQILPLGLHRKDKWFCSEFVMHVLGFDDPQQYSPGDCYRHFESK